jgi:acyl-coenzyme A synthetase/AMP-(fatty) acid ligase/thioesterase domain-containing protein
MTDTPRPLDLAVVDVDRAKGSAHSDLDHSWQCAGERPLDLGGPTDIPFEPFDDRAIQRSIVSRFHEIAGRYPTRTAIDDGETRLTYAEVWHIACHLARRIEGVAPPGRAVAVVLPNATLFPVAALACLAVANPYVPIDLDYPAARNAEILREAGVAAAITQPGLPAADTFIPTSLPLIYADATEALRAADEPSRNFGDATGAAVILFTSGSTGRPKGIYNDERALQLRITQYTNACHLNAEDRFILLSSPSTIAGVRDTFAALLNGATLRIAELLRLGISGVQQVIRDERISVYYSVPAVLRSLLGGAEAKAALASLRLVRLGGDTTFESDLALCRAVLPPTCHILVGFGSTEAPTVFQWFARPGMGDGLRLPSGFPAPGVAFALVGQDGAPVPKGEIGELVVRSRYNAFGLWQDGRLVPGPLESDRMDPDVRILRTGDLFRVRPDGMAEPCGRNDRQVKIRGLRVDPGEVEAALRRCHGVADAAVIVRQQNSMDSALVGFVVPQPGAPQLGNKDLRQAVSAWLPEPKCPAIIHVIEEIPRLPSFKPDMAALADLDLAWLSSKKLEEPSGALPTPLPDSLRVQDAVDRAWTAVFGARSLARDLPWEDAGGDSLKALQMLLHIEEDLGRYLSTEVLSAGMTPSILCTAIERLIGDVSEGVGQNTADDGRTTVFLMPGIVYDEPGLARFRHALRDQIRFVLIGYPNWREMIAARADFAALVTAAFAQILSQNDGRPIYLAGRSFGGIVAFATAHRLVEAGYRVASLGLLDTQRSRFSALPLITAIKQTKLIDKIRFHLQTRDIGVLLRLILRILLELRAFLLLEAFAKLCMKIDGRRAAPHLLFVLRSYALRGWRPKTLSVPTFFFRAEDDPPHQQYEFDWRGWCSAFNVVPIAGDHESMLAPANIERLCANFLETLRAAGANVGSFSPCSTDRLGMRPIEDTDCVVRNAEDLFLNP